MEQRKQDGYIKSEEFIAAARKHDYNENLIAEHFKELGYNPRPRDIRQRIRRMASTGKLKLKSGNSPELGMLLKKASTMYGPDGEIKLQWVQSETDANEYLESLSSIVSSITSNITPVSRVVSPSTSDNDATLYISNDVHFGALMWDKESGKDWNLELASQTLKEAYDYLFDCTPKSKIGIVCDLGDLLEVDNDKNMTPKSGNVLASDSRFPKILRVAYEGLIYAVYKALSKHEVVYFYNIVGNHDVNAAVAVREVIRMAFIDNPRVIVDDSPSNIKYHQHGTTLLGFAHGDGLKPKDAGEVMAYDNVGVFSSTQHRYFHFGHHHKDAVVDTKLCRSESHRNLAPLNAWAYNMGFRSGAGTMKAITYNAERGEISRQLYNV